MFLFISSSLFSQGGTISCNEQENEERNAGFNVLESLGSSACMYL